MNKEMHDILSHFAKEQGWKFGMQKLKLRGFSFTDTLCFSKVFKGRIVPKWQKLIAPTGIVEIRWDKEHPTRLRLYQPHMQVSMEGETYTESCSLIVNNNVTFPRIIDLIHPDSLDWLPLAFEQVDDEVEWFCKKTVWRHLEGRKNARKQRKRGGRKGRRDR